jgi:hypothetical protein
MDFCPCIRFTRFAFRANRNRPHDSIMAGRRSKRRRTAPGEATDEAPIPAIATSPAIDAVAAGKIGGFSGSVGSGDLVAKAVAIIRRKVCGRAPPVSPKGFESEQQQLETVLAASICSGESNSVLLIGPRGCGKSLVVERALANVVGPLSILFFVVVISRFCSLCSAPFEPHALSLASLKSCEMWTCVLWFGCWGSEQAATPEAAARGHYVVRLNGLLHSDDNVALKETSRQICLQSAAAEDSGSTAQSKAVKKRLSTADTIRQLLEGAFPLLGGARTDSRKHWHTSSQLAAHDASTQSDPREYDISVLHSSVCSPCPN